MTTTTKEFALRTAEEINALPLHLQAESALSDICTFLSTEGPEGFGSWLRAASRDAKFRLVADYRKALADGLSGRQALVSIGAL
jgi:hypothetical protein